MSLSTLITVCALALGGIEPTVYDNHVELTPDFVGPLSAELYQRLCEERELLTLEYEEYRKQPVDEAVLPPWEFMPDAKIDEFIPPRQTLCDYSRVQFPAHGDLVVVLADNSLMIVLYGVTGFYFYEAECRFEGDYPEYGCENTPFAGRGRLSGGDGGEAFIRPVPTDLMKLGFTVANCTVRLSNSQGHCDIVNPGYLFEMTELEQVEMEAAEGLGDDQ